MKRAGVSAWLPKIDFAQGVLTGRNLCNELYDPNYDPSKPSEGTAWLGDEVEDTSKMCCGNNFGEYYAGDTERNYGCWSRHYVRSPRLRLRNSNVIASGETMMNLV